MSKSEIDLFAQEIDNYEISIPSDIRIVAKSKFSDFAGIEQMKDRKDISYIRYNATPNVTIYIIE